MLQNLLKFSLLFALCTIVFSASAQVDGRAVYENQCRSCHKMEGRLTGPGLDGAFDRIKNGHPGFDDAQTTEWLKSWIKNSTAVINSGDEYAVNLFNEYGKAQMTSFLTLPADEIDAVIDYIQNWKDESIYPPKQVATTDTTPVEDNAGSNDSGITSTVLWVIIGALIIISLILSRISVVLGKIHVAKEGKKVPAERPLFQKPVVLTLISVAVIGFVLVTLADNAVKLGRQQNYQPEQPIKFSHKLHAGINEIDCKYCHVGVERGKQATIPSVNVCMNCHKAVQEGPVYGKEEIAKIYEAAGWDAEKLAYDPNKKPKAVEWVRIHNLPDHVYFSHQQHVKVGEIECQHCHGEIQEMDEVYQFASLSMGWCLNCHRETEIQFGDNPYYAAENSYEKFHNELSEGKIKGVTVEMIGGTECQKCHY